MTTRIEKAMTIKEVSDWVCEHLGRKRRTVYNTDNGTKYTWENGDSYEYAVKKWEVNKKIAHIIINGELAQVCISD